MGGAVGAVIVPGVRRHYFQMKRDWELPIWLMVQQTKEPVREGLVAMIEPFIDTIVVCTITQW